jgi:hypothetical protein
MTLVEWREFLFIFLLSLGCLACILSVAYFCLMLVEFKRLKKERDE